MRRSFLTTIFLLSSFVLVAHAWAAVHAVQEKQDEEEQKDPTKGSKNMDEVVPYSMEAVLPSAKQAMETFGFEIKKEKPDYLEGTRSRHVGVFVGSGGEKVKLKLSEKDDGTRVEIETGKGFVGRLGKKNWSTPIYEEMMRLLKEGTF